MTASETRLFRIFLGCAFGAVLIPMGYLDIGRNYEAEKSIDSYISAIAKAERFDQDSGAIKDRIKELKVTLGDNDSSRQGQSFSDFAAEARTLLARYGIEPLRYQVVGVGDETAVEFTVRCDALSLIRFLQDASKKDRSWAVPLISIHPDKTGRDVNATIRIRHAK